MPVFPVVEAVIGQSYRAHASGFEVVYKGPAPKKRVTDTQMYVLRAKGTGHENQVGAGYLLSTLAEPTVGLSLESVVGLTPASKTIALLEKLSDEDLRKLPDFDSRVKVHTAVAAELDRRGLAQAVTVAVQVPAETSPASAIDQEAGRILTVERPPVPLEPVSVVVERLLDETETTILAGRIAADALASEVPTPSASDDGASEGGDEVATAPTSPSPWPDAMSEPEGEESPAETPSPANGHYWLVMHHGCGKTFGPYRISKEAVETALQDEEHGKLCPLCHAYLDHDGAIPWRRPRWTIEDLEAMDEDALAALVPTTDKEHDMLLNFMGSAPKVRAGGPTPAEPDDNQPLRWGTAADWTPPAADWTPPGHTGTMAAPSAAPEAEAELVAHVEQEPPPVRPPIWAKPVVSTFTVTTWSTTRVEPDDELITAKATAETALGADYRWLRRGKQHDDGRPPEGEWVLCVTNPNVPEAVRAHSAATVDEAIKEAREWLATCRQPVEAPQRVRRRKAAPDITPEELAELRQEVAARGEALNQRSADLSAMQVEGDEALARAHAAEGRLREMQQDLATTKHEMATNLSVRNALVRDCDEKVARYREKAEQATATTDRYLAAAVTLERVENATGERLATVQGRELEVALGRIGATCQAIAPPPLPTLSEAGKKRALDLQANLRTLADNIAGEIAAQEARERLAALGLPVALNVVAR